MMLIKKHNPNRIKDPACDRVFYAFMYVFVAILMVLFIYPLYFVLIASFSSPTVISTGEFLLWPKSFTLSGYKNVFENAQIWRGYTNTILYVLFGTVTAVMVTVMAAFSMSRKELPGKGIISVLFIFTMYFDGGLIPTFITVKNLGLYNNPAVIVILSAFSVYNMIIARTYFKNSIPQEVQEAAYVDGCTTERLFFSIMLPLSKPIIAVLALYSAVGHWNSYFTAMIYLQKAEYAPLQLVLRQILLVGSSLNRSVEAVRETSQGADSLESLNMLVKYCVIVVSTVPIIAVYPFLQKYFIKGVMIGAVKG